MAATDKRSDQDPHHSGESDSPEYMAVLAEKLLKGEATPEQEQALENWYGRLTPPQQIVFLNQAGLDQSGSAKARFKKRLFNRIQASAGIEGPETVRQLDTQNKFRLWPRLAGSSTVPGRLGWGLAAAVVVFLLMFGWGSLNQPSTHEKKHTAQFEPVVPGSDGAILTLSDGRKVVLDSAVDGQIAADANSLLIKKGGVLNYVSSKDQMKTELVYNTMTTPKGRQFQLILPDSTKVWLNAASSIRYPTAFTGEKRTVSVTGEVYFEVTHHADQPFVVQTNKAQIEVLGTRFNVMAYEDEKEQATTLLEGKVLVRSLKNQSHFKYLDPGQQAQIKPGGQFYVTEADTQQVTAWVSGKLSMKNLDVATLLRKISRWYNIDIQYAGAVPKGRFGGVLNRSAQLSSVLEVMAFNGIHTKLVGRTLIVAP